jgi:hypothetical protein
MFVFKMRRCYSSVVSTRWAKYNGGLSIQVATTGCVKTADFTDAIKKKLPNQLKDFDYSLITLHESANGPAMDPDLPLSSCQAGLSATSPIFVKTPKSKISLILSSNLNQDMKEMMLNEDSKSKDSIIAAKDSIIAAKDSIIDSKDIIIVKSDDEIKALRASRDFLKRHLDARHIIENYESRFPVSRGKTMTRKEKWEQHFRLHPDVLAELNSRHQLQWPGKAVKFIQCYLGISTSKLLILVMDIL